jgi:hypothetical protein
MAQITPARKLFDLLVSRDFDPEILDNSGKPASDPSAAEIFSFDFRAESGKDYGTVVIMLDDDNNLDVYCADNVGKTMEGDDKNNWFAFLQQLKQFAVKNFMSFGIKNLNRLRYSMQGQAAIKEGLFESWSGKRNISWNAGANESRLVIKHNRNLGEGEARFRYVESLFIETVDGERFKLPFRNLTAGRAMLEHVRMGNRPYDLRGQHIAEMVNELTLLSRFKRANTGKLLEGDTAALVEQANTYYENLRNNLRNLTTRSGYTQYFESWQPTELSEEEVVIEGLKHLFVTQSIDQRIEDALPVIARIQQQENAMKEAAIFEAWANKLMEGTWQTPDTPEKQAELVKLLSTDLPVGADATNATEQLYGLLGDDVLFDQLEELAQRDANADARQVVLNRMQELGDDPDVMKVITGLNIDATAAMNPPEQTPADLEPTQEAVKDPATQTEDPAGTQQPNYPEYAQDLDSILKHAGVPAKERAAPNYEPELDEMSNPGVIPADIDGVPEEELEEINGSGVLSPINEKDHEELDEFAPLAAAIGGALGRAAVGSAAGTIKQGLATMAGRAVGSAIGDAISGPDHVDEASQCNMTEAGESCPVHGLKECDMEEGYSLGPIPTAESALQGQYGHSGRMKSVAKDTSFLDRLKELSGMIRSDKI